MDYEFFFGKAERRLDAVLFPLFNDLPLRFVLASKAVFSLSRRFTALTP